MRKHTVGFVGLGVMGFPMAGYLARAGHKVSVYNRTATRTEAWRQCYEGLACTTPAQAAQGADFVFLCVGNDDDVRSVVYGPDGVLAQLRAGAVLVDHTTASAELARELAFTCAEHGATFVDAPVSGGEVGAQRGALTVMCGGDADAYAWVEPVMQAYARCVRRLGEAGAGQLAKMVNQICIAGVVEGLAEGLLFAQHAGLPVAEVIEVIAQGAAQSWQMENRYQTMLADHYNHGFAVDWMRKDLAIVQTEASRLGLSLPVTAMVDGFYAEVQEMGGGRWDTSSLLRRLQRVYSAKQEST